MNTLPQDVCDYLCQIPLKNDHLAYLIADPEGLLTDFGGSLEHYSLTPLYRNESIEDQITCLNGLWPVGGSTEVLEFLQITTGRIADVHIVQTETGSIVLFYDATSRVEQQKRKLEAARKGFVPGIVSGVGATEVFHEGENLFLNHLLLLLDVVVLEHQEEDVFTVLGTPPAWFYLLDPVAAGNKRFFANAHPFLSNFLFDASEYWNNKTSGRLRSSIWVQRDDADTEYTLSASVLRFGSRNIMLLESLGSRHIDHQSVLQRARVAEINFKDNIASLERENIGLGELATTDDLTKLNNRYGFHIKGEQQLAESIESSNPLMVLVMDMNNFKVINDTQGHHIGDLALIKTAEVLRSVFRDTDTLGRIGGDEFAVVVPRTDSSHVDLLVDRITTRLEQFNEQSEYDITLALSVGIAQSSLRASETLEDLLQQADERMYVEKYLQRRQG